MRVKLADKFESLVINFRKLLLLLPCEPLSPDLDALRVMRPWAISPSTTLSAALERGGKRMGNIVNHGVSC